MINDENKRKGRVMGVDFGDARTGIAVSDVTGFLASGVGVLRTTGIKSAARAVADEAKRHGVVLIVIGNPINMNGTEGPRSERVRAFAEEVATLTGLPVELFDERLTTAAAHRIMNETDTRGRRRKRAIDALSAEIILQNYLDSHR